VTALLLTSNIHESVANAKVGLYSASSRQQRVYEGLGSSEEIYSKPTQET